MFSRGIFLFVLMGVLSFRVLLAQVNDSSMRFVDYNPVSTLVVPENPVTKSKFPFIDVHNHQWNMPEQNLKEVTDAMDRLNMAVMVNLSGRSGDMLKKALGNASKNAPGRFILFANVDFSTVDSPGWAERATAQLEADVKNGANGLKIFKGLGLTQALSDGSRLRVDDPRLAPLWDKAGELGIPVLIHTGEPAIFWAPIDEKNERWLEMVQFPSRHRGNNDFFPPWEELMQEQWTIFRRHPKTNFINAHLGWLGNDLGKLGRLMDEFPNMYTEIGAVLAELGRQPRMAREFFLKYQDRIMFGKDSWNPEEYFVYFRVLETEDEYFDYYRKRHAFWKMYGLGLPDEVLRKLYYKNALRIIPNIDASLFPKD